MDIERIRELVELLQGTDIRRLEVKWEGGQIDLEREIGGYSNVVAAHTPPPDQLVQTAPVPPLAHVSLPVTAAVPVVAATDAAPPTERPGEVVTSPFVGTFYRAPAPGTRAFTAVGARVGKGDTLCIVEAMKLMNEIESEFSGVIKEILVDNEATVQFGQELFVIEVD